MLRIHLLQHWFNLADPGVEDALYESPVPRGFVGIDLGREPVPEETTVMRFGHLLEQHQLGRERFETINAVPRQKGLLLQKGTIVDATVISAPSGVSPRRQPTLPRFMTSTCPILQSRCRYARARSNRSGMDR
jgi:IS5 family transposase